MPAVSLGWRGRSEYNSALRRLFELEEFGVSPAVEQGRQLEGELPNKKA